MSNGNFHHPFAHPYQVQLDLMNAIYKTLNNGFKIGLFESPTGTGKTLSLICSTMTYLREQKRLLNEGTIKEKLSTDGDGDDDDEPDWVKSAYRDKIIDEYLTQAKLFEEHLEEVKKTGTGVTVEDKGKVTHYKKRRKQETNAKPKEEDLDNWDDLLPDNYELGNSSSGNKLAFDDDVISMMSKLEKSSNIKSGIRPSTINESKVKIYFVSRTHSQLSQFSSQLRMTQFPSSISDDSKERIKYLPLGSRKQLCINEDVSNLNDLSSINEKCKELQNDKDHHCQFMPSTQSQEDTLKVQRLNDLIMADIHDIEDLNDLGSKIGMCPYYSTRGDIPIAEIISMPYQLLLHKETRQFIGIDLKDSIVIIDEAHNLIDTITRIYSSSINLRDLELVRKGLKQYIKKFMLKMSLGNRVNLSKLMKLVSGLYKFMAKKSVDVKPGEEINREEIFENDSSDLLNSYTLDDYFNKSKIAYKLESYMGKISKGDETSTFKPSLQSPLLFKIRSFIQCLSNPLKSGKFFFDKQDAEVSLKYLLLDPSEDFKDIVQDAKCVMLAGGTMEPIADFTDFLFPQVPKEEINSFSCNHVIPDENLMVFPISKYGGLNFEFTFRYRDDPKLINGLGEALLKLLSDVPDGVVSFFPSYNYLNKVITVWKQSGMYTRLNAIKPIFVETRTCQVDLILNEYKESIQSEKRCGAFLLSVVGGKMSEGINFSDELARAVVMIGMPYPNAFSGELIAKQSFIEKSYKSNGFSDFECKQKSRDFYENLCMKAVNQSVGRAIRNIKDYSVIFLFDCRYSSTKVNQKLSNWIRKRVIGSGMDVNNVSNETKRFFSSKKAV